MQEFEKARPRIFGALLDAVVGALHDLPETHVDRLPRMADFAKWATAAERTLGWEKGTFMAAYEGNRTAANEVALEAYPVAQPLLELLEEESGWAGTPSELLQALELRVSEQVKRQKGWPRNARALSGHLKGLSPNLRAAGWEVESGRTSAGRHWMMQRVANVASSGEFASRLRHAETGADRCRSMQIDATSPAHDANDANDANDAKSGTTLAPSERNDEEWEEGYREVGL